MQTLLFDIDGTLVMSEPADSACFAEAYCAVFGDPAPSTAWGDYAHVTDWGILDQALGASRGRSSTFDERAAFELAYRGAWQRVHEKEPSTCAEVPGAAGLVAELMADTKWNYGIATGGTRGAAAFKLAAAGIAADGLPGAYANGAIPRAAIVRNALRAVNARCDDTVYIGDGHWDVVTCRALGLRFVGVSAECSAESLRDAGATQVVPDFRDREAFWRAVASAECPR